MQRDTKRPQSPLGKWLSANSVTQREFAKILAEYREAAVGQSEISQWCTGVRNPCDSIIVAIEGCTGGEVRREEWACWRARQARRKARAA